ncbi:transposase [Klebsiella pneumoniae]|nr:transposase [Klebsiella pneumoniae]
MNVDEVAFKKGHRYITVISDRDGRALALTDDRGTESLAGYLRTLTDRQLLGYQNALNGHERRLHKSSAYPLTQCG